MARVKQRRNGTLQRKRMEDQVSSIVASVMSDRHCIVQLLANKRKGVTRPPSDIQHVQETLFLVSSDI